MAALFASVNATDMCCEKCGVNDDKIKTYSIDHIFNMCGEACMEASDFWKYKLFEPGLTKVDRGDATPCHDAGYTNYYETDTHGVPHIITMTLDMYKMPKEETFKRFSQPEKSDVEVIEVQEDTNTFLSN